MDPGYPVAGGSYTPLLEEQEGVVQQSLPRLLISSSDACMSVDQQSHAALQMHPGCPDGAKSTDIPFTVATISADLYCLWALLH